LLLCGEALYDTHEKMHTTRRWPVILIAGLLVLTLVQMAGAAGEVTWYWKNDIFTDPPTTHTSDMIMDMYSPTGATDDIVTLGPGERAWWYAENAAQCDLTFPEGNWVFHFWIATNSADSERVYPRVVRVHNSNSEYVTSSSSYNLIKSDEGVKEITYGVSGDLTNFQQEDRVAVELLFSASAEAGEWLKIYYNYSAHNSTLTSPPSSPAYPVPESSVLILFLTGLIALVGYVALNR
jgi:hypothetical protein